MLTKNQFDVLYHFREGNSPSQRDLAAKTGFSLGKVNRIVQELKESGLLQNNGKLSASGHTELDAYKVDNAIILAAGMSSRFIPISYEHPKGLTIVKGEVLIERQIRQLQQAGVKEIIVVIGYMQEKFYYLEQKFGVILITNNEFRVKNTHSSIYAAKKYLHNTYICCSDNYYPQNLFKSHEYHSMYCTQFHEGYTRTERGVITDKNGLIVETVKPCHDMWTIQGHAYLDRQFTQTFLEILEHYYNAPGTNDLYWEVIYAENLKLLPMYERKCSADDIHEFDSMEDLRQFDPDYLLSNNTHITDSICQSLHVHANEIHEIVPLNSGLTNQSFRFTCKGEKYVFRVPGKGTTGFIDRKLEKFALATARDLKLDESYLCANEEEGWKISRFIEVTEPFDFRNSRHLQMLCDHLRKLHQSGVQCGRLFDFYIEAEKLLNSLDSIQNTTASQFQSIREEIRLIHDSVVDDAWPVQLAHNDLYETNLLVSGEKLFIIDWEYAGDTDIGFDICKLFTTNDMPVQDIGDSLFIYYNRQPTNAEKKHLIGCAAICYYYWFVWAIRQNQFGADCFDWETIWFRRMNYYANAFKKMKGE